MAKKQHDPYKDFRALSKEEQRESLLDVSSMCIDGAPVSLARRLEIYFDVSPDEQKERRHELFRNHF